MPISIIATDFHIIVLFAVILLFPLILCEYCLLFPLLPVLVSIIYPCYYSYLLNYNLNKYYTT